MGCARARRDDGDGPVRRERTTGTTTKTRKSALAPRGGATSAFPLGGYSFTNFELEDDVG